MNRSCNTLVLAAISLSALAGCQNNEQTFGAGGAAVGALACGAIGNAIFRTTAGTLGSAAACGTAGYFIGSAIGRNMDERDRQVAYQATQQALAQPVPAAYYPPPSSPSRPVNAVRPPPPVRPVAWNSDHGTGNRGSAAVVAVEPPRPGGGGECRTVREVAYIKGQEQSQESKYCRGPDGEWGAA